MWLVTTVLTMVSIVLNNAGRTQNILSHSPTLNNFNLMKFVEACCICLLNIQTRICSVLENVLCAPKKNQGFCHCWLYCYLICPLGHFVNHIVHIYYILRHFFCLPSFTKGVV